MADSDETFGRGLLFHEVAIVKRMSERGNTRDYIFSFLARPGRKLTPACISEIDQGKIGREIDAASDAEVDAFIAKRLAETPEDTTSFGPLSAFQIGQALNWLVRPQGDLLQDETQQVEFKSLIQGDVDSAVRYAKTLAALANNRGGYIFFGFSDDRQVVGVDEDAFLSYDWDRLTALAREHFQPSYRWERGMAVWKKTRIGVIYVFEAESKPIVAARDGRASVRQGDIYYRYRGQNQRISIGDLFGLLQERDDRVRTAVMRTLGLTSTADSQPA